MKITRKQWRTVAALARQEGYEGSTGDFEAVKNYLVDEALFTTLSIDGKNASIKALTVEMSEDQTQVLVTEGAAQTEMAEGEEDETAPPQQNGLSDVRLNSMVEDALRKNGVDLAKSKRPQNPNAVTVLGPADEVTYDRKAKRGETAFSSGAVAKSFDAFLKGKILNKTGEFDKAKKHFDFCSKVAEKNGVRPDVVKAMATSPASAGGALTEVMYEPDLIRLVDEYGIITRLVGMRDMPEQSVTLKRRTGGPTVYYPNENTAITESSPTYDNVQLTAKTGLALTQISNQTLAYASPDAGDEAAREISWTFARHIDDSVFGGDGAGKGGGSGNTLPGRTGFYNSYGASAATNTGYVCVGGDTTQGHTPTQLATMLGRLPLYARAGAVISGSPEKLEEGIGRLARASGGVTMMEYGSFGFVQSFAGIPIIPNLSDVNGSETTGGDPADQVDYLFGNFGLACKIYRTGALEIDVSDQRYWDQYATAVRGALNWDFAVHDVGDINNAGPVVSFWQT